ncbi:MAG: DUF1015 domain-containing protein [Acidobacteriota bacterium]|nr:DUF1015 domain-containing protein [Acidobacteriota bacterium]
MATLYPFRALRPMPAAAGRVAAVPYDVVTTDEARALAAGNPLSFLHVSRAEIDLPPSTDPHADAVYEQARQNFERLRTAAPLVVEERPTVYVYRLRMGGHQQTGIAACYSLDEYNGDRIKKHERTRRDKEDDRTRHMLTLRAQTGPVFLTYRASADVDAVAARVTAAAPLFDVAAPDGVQHTIWAAPDADGQALVAAFGRIPALYIADGHHRAASAARAHQQLGEEASERFLAVAFPHDQMQVLPYNRIVRDLAGLTPEAFLAEVRRRFTVKDGPATPARKGEVAMYLGGRWQTIVLSGASGGDAIGTLDVSLLQDGLLEPVLKVADPRTDKRIDFVGGIRGTGELAQAVDGGRAAVAFSMYPVGVGELMAIADQGGIMPPKSTWFEPKLRDGLLIHLI